MTAKSKCRVNFIRSPPSVPPSGGETGGAVSVFPRNIMSYCINPHCKKPQNSKKTDCCRSCGNKLLLKDRYRAVKPIGQGGFGKTFLATDEDKPSKPYCVIKQFFPQIEGTDAIKKGAELFAREAMQLEELGEHEQIPTLFAYFAEDSRQYLIQEFIDGENLAGELAHSGAYDESYIISLLQDLLKVLEFVHSRNVIHRDIKPENIIRPQDNGQLVLVDFGAAKAVTAGTLGQVGTAIGSVGYIAPEQAVGRATFASDIYSLGVTSIHLLTGVNPGELYDNYQGVWQWRNYLQKEISNGLAQILDKMLIDNSQLRYQSAGEVRPDLEKLLNIPPTQPFKMELDLQLEQLKRERLEREKSKPQSSVNPAVSESNQDLDSQLEQLKQQFSQKFE